MDRVAALFDMDRTLLDTSSGLLYTRYLHRNGLIGRRELARVIWWAVLTRLGALDMSTMIPRLLADAAGDDEQQTRELCDRWFTQDVRVHLTEIGQQRVQEHQRQGHIIAIVSGSTQYVVRPLAEYLGIGDNYVCTYLESENGRFTGKIRPPACYGAGKVVWAERFAAKHGVDLSASYFYTDSISDLPLLERVGNQIAVNPDLRLRRLAQERGWRIEMFY